MKIRSALVVCAVMVALRSTLAADPPATDVIPTTAGDLSITFIGHGSLMFRFAGKVIHVDPYGKLADYSTLPKANIILITHEHPDHLDLEALAKVRTAGTDVVLPALCAQRLGGGQVLTNGQAATVQGLRIEAVPAYNIVHKRDDGSPYHPRGVGNGYVLTFGDKRVYVAGDTENVPEMGGLKDIACAFLPMNLPYTMTPEMVAAAARAFRPRILYPYHYGDTDPARLVQLLKDEAAIEIRVRNLR